MLEIAASLVLLGEAAAAITIESQARVSTSEIETNKAILDRESFADLVTEIRSCSLCEGLPLGPKPILKVDKSARILIAGQAPGRITHHKGIPFDDPSGDRLRDWLGVSRETFYEDPRIGILPMGLCFPGTGSGGDLAPRPECAAAWRKRVLAEMEQLELVLVIGRYAIDWHFPAVSKLSVTALALDWKNYWPDALILPHPSPRNNRWLKNNPWFQTDILPMLADRVDAILSQPIE